MLNKKQLEAILKVVKIEDIEIKEEAWEEIKGRILLLTRPFFKGDT